VSIVDFSAECNCLTRGWPDAYVRALFQALDIRRGVRARKADVRDHSCKPNSTSTSIQRSRLDLRRLPAMPRIFEVGPEDLWLTIIAANKHDDFKPLSALLTRICLPVHLATATDHARMRKRKTTNRHQHLLARGKTRGYSPVAAVVRHGRRVEVVVKNR